MKRRETREEAMKLLFEMSINKYTPEEALENYMENTEVNIDELDMQYLKRVIEGIYNKSDVIDSEIQKNLIDWKMSRVSRINLAILRVCTYELLFEKDIPKASSINEAVELAKRYSDDKAAAFVNGVLDKVAKQSSETV